MWLVSSCQKSPVPSPMHSTRCWLLNYCRFVRVLVPFVAAVVVAAAVVAAAVVVVLRCPLLLQPRPPLPLGIQTVDKTKEIIIIGRKSEINLYLIKTPGRSIL